ncbi:DUF2442 domain-containing protein [Hymenobacter sp. GOD-10R]|uniref:DUF2442 domain-containing protein n=1 Tax=Hymenobacter sp. GOD-10R TaxID=3093922 RepID=UPI002D77D3EB|nr:DUF2442 domain-containing protein [Hymenobacter sp. GOD-10R]WRQ29133.1 DUF2442 domain-containing protein [Hymenobacter sp. GOD-10R]
MASINRVEFTTTSIYVFLSGSTFWPCLLTAQPATFLYHATPAQRANWQLADRDTAVEWPDLGEKLTLEQMK